MQNCEAYRHCALGKRGGTAGEARRTCCSATGRISRSLRWGEDLGCIIRWCNRCVERALTDGPLAAVDGRPRPGEEPTITLEAKALKAKDHGDPHVGRGTGMSRQLVQGTVCKILGTPRRCCCVAARSIRISLLFSLMPGNFAVHNFSAD